jgi:phage shock protein A
LTDERYEDMLQEKLLKLEAEISIIDDKIEGFRQKAKEMAAKRAQEQAQEQVQAQSPRA